MWACHDCNNLKGKKLPVDEKLASENDSISECNRDDLLDKRYKVYSEFKRTISAAKIFVSAYKRAEYIKEHLIIPVLKDKELNYVALRKFIIKSYLVEMLVEE